jgi:hypothetical protein
LHVRSSKILSRFKVKLCSQVITINDYLEKSKSLSISNSDPSVSIDRKSITGGTFCFCRRSNQEIVLTEYFWPLFLVSEWWSELVKEFIVEK